MKEKNPIDELFKRRLTEGNPPFNEAHWKAMEHQLGSKKRRFGLWLWMVPLLLVLGVTVYGVVKWNENHTAQTQSVQNLTQSENNKDNSISLSETKNTTVATEPITNAKTQAEPLNENEFQAKTQAGESEEKLAENKGQLPNDEPRIDHTESGEQRQQGPAESTENQGKKASGSAAQNKQGNSSAGRAGANDGGSIDGDDGDVNDDIDLNTDPIQSEGEDSLPKADGLGQPGASFDEQKLDFNERSLKMPLLGPQTLFVQEAGVMNAKTNLIEKFKPRHWRLSAVSTFGKYAAKEKLETTTDRSVLSTFAEPVPLLSQSFGLRLDYLKRGWVFSSGLSYSTIREEVDFGVNDSTFVGFEYFEYQEVDSISIIVVEIVDSTFVDNEWILDTTFVQVEDTTFISVVDSMEVFEGGEPLLEERPYKQQVSYIELPLMVGKQFPLGAKGAFTLRTGPVIGFRTTVKGYYVVYSGSGDEEQQTLSDRREISKSVVLNWKTELEYAYQFSGKMSFGVLVGDRRAISPYFQNRGAKLLYKGQYVGLSLGYLF